MRRRGQWRRNQAGNTILIAAVLVLGMTLTSVGLAQFLRRSAENATEIKRAGYPALQALYMAERGVNDLIYRCNDPGPVADPITLPLSGIPGAVIPLVISYPGWSPFTLNHSYTIAAVAGSPNTFDLNGQVQDGVNPVWSRVVRVRLANTGPGGMWVLASYERR